LSSSNSERPPADLLEVGRVEKPHGLKGEVVVKLLTNMVEDRTVAGTVFQAGGRSLTVVRSRPHGRRWLVTFEGIADREGADAIRGLALHAPALSTDGSDPGPQAASAHHGAEVVAFVHELIGRRIVDQHGVDHGPVTAVIENPASDLLELGDGRLVPLTFYRGADPEAGTISVDVPPGLLDGDTAAG
jgi:16S rRNA processing protein RimM